MLKDAHALLDSLDALPVMPAVAARILSYTDDTGSAADIAEVLQSDPVLTATLLRVANSAYYGFARSISTVREAVVLLGFKQVRQTAVGASLMRAWRPASGVPDGFNLDLFWGHSLTVALTAETGARKFNVGRAEDAFTAGIMHDLGTLALRRARPLHFAAAIRACQQRGLSLHDSELEFVGLSHDQVGAALLERWNLPENLVGGIAGHHDADASPRTHGLGGVLAAADEIANRYGIHAGWGDGPTAPIRDFPEDIATLEIASGGISGIVERAHAFIANVSGPPRTWYAMAAA